jgi:parvulin-like peptidyl-prolyl isomerase
MRLMEMIRRKGALFLTIFLGIFIISVFAGLGVGFFNFNTTQQQQQANPAGKGRGAALLVEDKALADTALRVNGRAIDREQFSELLALVSTNNRSDDPSETMQAYIQTAGYLIREELVMAKGEELGVKVTDADLAKAKEDATSQFMQTEEEKKGNLLGDLAQKLGTARERRQAFEEYLQRNGLDATTWAHRAKRQLFIENTRKKLQEAADAKKALKSQERKAQVDAKLKEGLSFAEVAKLFSEDDNAAGGGDLNTWVAPGLLLEDVEKIVFATPKGQITDWIEIPAGWQRFEIYDVKQSTPEEIEKNKADLIKQIRDKRKDDKYEPTAEELAASTKEVKARQILLKNEDSGAADTEINDMIKAATIEINDPVVLAAQALMDDKLQPPASMTFDELVKIAQTAAVGEGYDFALIQAKLDNGQPEATAKSDSATDGTDAAAPSGAAAAAPATDAAATATPDTAAADAASTPATPDAAAAPDAAKPEEKPASKVDATQPCYPLAIGLFNLSLQRNEESAGSFPYFMIGKIYTDWLALDPAPGQPVDRQKARDAIEQQLERAKGLDYNSLYYAMRGLNLAWLGQADKAKENLELAQKYAPQTAGPMWDFMRQGYEVLDDKDKVQQIDDLLTKLRQQQLQQMIQQQQQQQQQGGGGGGGMPIQIPQ